MKDWFAVEELIAGTWLIAEPGHVNCFLIEGTDRAVLVDTGIGLGDIGQVARSLTRKPILVVNSHGHDDHRGGNWLFDQVAAHPLAAAALTTAAPVKRLAGYLDVAREQRRAYELAAAADERFFHAFTDTTTPRPLPADAEDWAVPAGPVPTSLADRQVIDLGGRALTVLHTPGHSPDSICLLDAAAGLLFAGDTLITGDFWAHTPDTELPEFARTLRKLDQELASQLRAICPAHSMRYWVTPNFLRRAADAFETIVAGESTPRLGTDLLNRPALRHEFADFTVLRPVHD